VKPKHQLSDELLVKRQKNIVSFLLLDHLIYFKPIRENGLGWF